VVRRAEMLAELMRFKQAIAVGGTHGKTTTTSMVAALLDAGGLDPTVINGGIINAYGTNARMGKGDWMVVEADESRRHLRQAAGRRRGGHQHRSRASRSLRRFRRGPFAPFRQFVENVPFYGFAVMCLDHPEVQAMVGRIEDRQVITYGQNRQADVRFFDLATHGVNSIFSVEMRDRLSGTSEVIESLTLPMPGLHNVSNAVAAVAVAWKLGIEPARIRQGLASFGGVKRRFTHTGNAGGIDVFDDYAHHPVEIRAVLSAARAVASGEVIAVVQPHRYTRLESLLDEFSSCFNDADHVICAPVYAAGEQPREGIDHIALANGIRASGHRNVHAIDGEDELAGCIAGIASPGDYVVCLGAGSISQWAQVLPEALARALDDAATGGAS
jgi:UDP-N-acetylmuramate--alanine ligase